MVELHYIDKHIEEMLGYLGSIQNNDGSFDTMYLQPYYNPDKGWMRYAGNSPYETAAPLIPLLFLTSDNSRQIIHKAIKYIIKKSLDAFLWTYAYPSKNALVPYDTDSTSLCSYVLKKNGYTVKNKNFLNEYIDSKSYYLFYIWHPKKSSKIPFSTYIKLKWRNWKTRNSLNITNTILRLNDSEFTSSCINLMYLNKMKKNEAVWHKIHSVFENNKIDFLYYIDLYHAFYCYARLVGYEHHKDLLPKTEILNEYISRLYEKLNEISFSPKNILLMNAILFFDIDLSNHKNLLERCFKDIAQKKYKENTAFYSSNAETDFQPNTKLPNTYFGSPAITCSLYIEFLNLYRKKIYDSYYEGY